ncbi:MAG: hypothetical protein CMI55_00635 [Parcubacteria group bacterium]|jgi:UPF0755 protein|nr:hypothetical protein [Parcubacteria group bacterium]|tara:strand:+ start:295 stop:1284 length:990 start_codon:yes stop_codon:yes gene_type:complete
MKINNKKKFVYFVLSVILVFLILCSVAGYFFIRYQFTIPLKTQAAEQIFVIEKGRGVKEIAADLEEAELIRSSTVFEYYVWYKRWTARLQAGEYYLSPSSSVAQIAQKIVKGEIMPRGIKVTIPEGFALKRIDERLFQAGLIKQGELIKFNSSSNLEGYLFPDTYIFNKDMSLEDITNKMLDNFDNKLSEELRAEIERQDKTIAQIIIMASIIEKEVAAYQDLRMVSGVFWGRLDINYPLESCATIAYILGIDKWRYSIVDTKVDSPYNTYQNKGLPPGPISNPGLLAIKAAIYPIETDYKFFLSKPDGETVFSRTFEEHLENRAKYLD